MTSTATDRPNIQLAAAVDHALDLLNEDGRRAAVTLLESAGASFATIGRVLCEPARRRARTHVNADPLPTTL